MKDISIRSTLVLSILGLLSVGLMILVEFTKKEQPQPHYEEKIAAARLMEQSINYLKEKHFKNEVAIDNINDPNDTRIIGTRFSAITSGRGSLPVKLSTVNPNFAAMVVELFKDARIREGDHIAIGATGSFPALNIAVSSAAEAMKLEVSFIASATSSSWGANDPEYTYLDIHHSLYEAGLFKHQILASSIGANQDIGMTLSPEGRDLARAAIQRNNIEFINGQSLNDNIEKRLELFVEREKETGKRIKLYINVGGGIASLGSNLNSEEIPSGLLRDVKLSSFPDKKGVMFRMASQRVPFINLRNIQRLMDKYNLPRDPVPLPAVGEGELFMALRYDLRYVFGAAGILVILIVGVILFDRRQNALGNEVVYTENQS